jgi:uncharacterized membrane protein YfcA
MDFINWIVPSEASVVNWQYIAVAGFAMLLIGISKGGFGGGIGMLATPLIIMVLKPEIALPLILPILIIADIATINRFPREWDLKSFFFLAPGTFAGLFVGLYFLNKISDDGFIKVMVGAIAVIFAGLKFFGRFWILKLFNRRPGLAAGIFVGLVCGFTTMIAHAAGVIVSMFMLSRKLEKRVFVGTCARFFFVFNTLKIPFFIKAENHPLTLYTLKIGLWLMPLTIIGVFIGAWINKRIPGKNFEKVICVMLGLCGLYLILRSVV